MHVHIFHHTQYVKRNRAALEEPLKAVTRPLDQMFTLRELDENVRAYGWCNLLVQGPRRTNCNCNCNWVGGPTRNQSIHTHTHTQITVPLGGFESLEDYMTTSSCSEVLDRVAVPLLGINAQNDPFISKEALEHTVERASRNPLVLLVMTPTGGHIGWGEGLFLRLFRASWAERLCVEFLEAVHLLRGGSGGGLVEGAAPRSRL